MKLFIKNKLKSNFYTYYFISGLRNYLRKFPNIFFYTYSYFLWFRLSKKKSIKLELGSGEKKGKDQWVTVDNYSKADIFWDLRRRIPLKDSTVDCIYSSHLLEHIPYQELLLFLKKCLKLLKKDGCFSVCVPSVRNYLDAYINGDEFFEKAKACKGALVETGSKLDQLNYIAYMAGQHNYMFDEENLVNILKKVGFKRVKIRQFDPKIDNKGRDYESIYAICYKH